MVSFANWAYLDKDSEIEYKKTGDFSNDFWKSGDRPWVIDVVSKVNGSKIMHWLRHNFKKVKWIKLNKLSKRIGKKGY